MMRKLIIALVSFTTLIGCTNPPPKVVKIEMQLSAFDVESDDFPNIEATIDLSKNTAICKKWYYALSHKASTYSLYKKELKAISEILTGLNLKNLKPEYKVERTDQPSSKIIFYTTKAKYIINDYGLQGECPLPELYKIVYKF